jgi:hypothetical protein
MSSQSRRLEPPVTEASIEAAKTSALRELRAGAVDLATARGHYLGRLWHELDDACEVAYCKTCWRAAVVDVLREPRLAGPALSEPCAPRRPDAFLANQHESRTRGAR